jgi:hypothetical protein
MPLPDRDASSYGPRARRHYRRFRITRPVESDRSTWELPSERDSGLRKSPKSRILSGSSLWLLTVLAITVFTFICLVLIIIGMRWLASSF